MEGVIDLGKELGISGSMQENVTAVTIRGCLADRADHSYCFVRVASPSESCCWVVWPCGYLTYLSVSIVGINSGRPCSGFLQYVGNGRRFEHPLYLWDSLVSWKRK